MILRQKEEKAEPDGRSQQLALHLCLQNITEKLQAELQETQSKIKAVEKRHKEEIKTMKEETNVLLQQRDVLQNQVSETAIATAVISQVVSPHGRAAGDGVSPSGCHHTVVSISAGLKETDRPAAALDRWAALCACLPALIRMDFCWPVTASLVF